MNDLELLGILKDERVRAIGFDNASELIDQRERALNYFKGYMPDMPTMPNRSKAVDTVIADAIETLLPDLVEIFTGGDDVAVFVPNGEEDEEAARQETDYINHVVFQDNNGWMVLYTMFKDAMQSKTGVVKYAWEEGHEQTETFERKSAVAVEAAAKAGEIIDLKPCEPEEGDEEPYYDFTVKRRGRGKVCVLPIPPEDFAVAVDTVTLRDATYCAMRSRPRAQDLIGQGYSEEEVSKLPSYGPYDTGIEQARDTVGENDLPQNGSNGNFRRVEVVEHYLKVITSQKATIWRVVTGNKESVLLDKEEVDCIPFAAITPYVVTHRFYGESVADKLIEPQRVATALTRATMDSIYFALNQRVEVDMTGADASTLPDLLRNEPGVPIRVKRAGTIAPIQAGSLNYSPYEALEYFQTKVEQRTGIVRAAQGLTPDTLHETAKGALALLTQAQKRVRLIARIFAETGVKDLFLGVHALIRKHADEKSVVRLRNKWTEIDPTSWGERNDMTIEIGVGAGGKEAEMALLTQQGAMLNEIIALQGGPVGPIVTVENVYNYAQASLEKMGVKAPEKYVTDPATAPPQEPKPDPEVIKAQEELMLQREKAEAELRQKQEDSAANLQLKMTETEAKSALEMEKLQREFDLRQQQLAAETQAKAEQVAAELELKREQLSAELMLKREQMAAELALKEEAMRRDAARKDAETSSDIGDVSVGGEPG